MSIHFQKWMEKAAPLSLALWGCEPLVPPDVTGTGGAAGQAELLEPPAQTETPEIAPFGQVWVVASGLTSEAPPAVGLFGCSFLDYGSSGQVSVTFVDFAGSLSSWHREDPGYFAEVAAHGERHLALLHRPNHYGIYDRGRGEELSGSAASYKESLAVNSLGFAWMDYGEPGSSGAPVNLSSLTFQTWGGERRVLTDASRYRAELDASETHLAYVEYADTSANAIGQVLVVSLDGAQTFPVAPSASHQGKPAIDGEWVVWEEYSTPSTTRIRAANLTTRVVLELTDDAAFRTNADVKGSLVVWEDHRSGNGNIYEIDLGATLASGEREIVSLPSHSTGPRLVDDGLVWIESFADRIELRLGYWANAP